MSDKILVIDDDESIRWVIAKAFEKNGYDVTSASNGSNGFELLKKGDFAVAFVDIMMPDISGLELLSMAAKTDLDTSFVIMTAQNTMKNAIEAMKFGAYDYITKPFDLGEIKEIAAKAIEARSLSKNLVERAELTDVDPEVGINIIGKSFAMQKIYKTVGKVSGSDVTVLIQGESGTGKELIAKAIHTHSERADRPFIAINSAAIPKELLESELFGHEKGAFSGAVAKKAGKFELAHKGTLFLDEIGDMDLDLQMKLLRALQEKEIDSVGGAKPVKVDVRVIAATNKDLARAVKEKTFREDLYYRLNVVNIKMPALKDRKKDIGLLIEYFLGRYSEDGNRKQFADAALKAMTKFSWPGNVRELENTIRRAVVLSTSQTILFEDLPSKIRELGIKAHADMGDTSLEELMRIKLEPLLAAVDEENTEGLYAMVLTQLERPLIGLVLEKCKWNQLKAARVLGLNRNTLRKKINTLDIKKTNEKS
jgi:two-component system nitrogen regulation response regulator GlnG